jgi:hypothetical protein
MGNGFIISRRKQSLYTAALFASQRPVGIPIHAVLAGLDTVGESLKTSATITSALKSQNLLN